MTFSQKILITIGVFVIGLVSGVIIDRKTTSKSAITTKTDTDIVADDKDHKVTVIVKKPNGEETTTITEDNHNDTKENINQNTIAVITAPVKSKINISVLAGFDHLTDLQPKYGLSVSKEVLGTVTVGAFGLTNGIVGVSVGINF